MAARLLIIRFPFTRGSQTFAWTARIAPFLFHTTHGEHAVTDKTSLSYKDAGVDIDAGNALVDRIKGDVKKTRRPEVMGGLGGFGALCALPQKYREPILVSGTDGVGTKLRLAMDLKRHDAIGIDAYFVPNILSPASPRPGIMYPCSFSP